MPKSTKSAGDGGLAAVFILSLNVIQGVFVDGLVCLAFFFGGGVVVMEGIVWSCMVCGRVFLVKLLSIAFSRRLVLPFYRTFPTCLREHSCAKHAYTRAFMHAIHRLSHVQRGAQCGTCCDQDANLPTR